jgi:hypothetical protein
VFVSREGDRWICQNVRCRCEFEVVKPCVVNSGSNARCCCGSEMTRRYVAPSVRKMDAAEAETLLEEAELPLKIGAAHRKHSKT